jgi:hypothetical protein
MDVVTFVKILATIRAWLLGGVSKEWRMGDDENANIMNYIDCQLETVRDAVPLYVEIEKLRRIRHLAMSYREAEIECMSSFDAAPRERRYRRRLELDALLGIEKDWQGVA